MVKKSKKQFIWQEPTPKIRKPRTKKAQKEEDNPEQSNILGDSIREDNIMNEQQIVNEQKSPLNDDFQKQIQEIQALGKDPIDQIAIQMHERNEDQRKSLQQRLKTIKEILYDDDYIDSNRKNANLSNYRNEEYQEIISFLDKQVQQFTLNFNILYIYGSPGSGKTFAIKNILQNKNLQPKAKWINCLTMLNTSLLKHKQPITPQQDKKYHILVIDEFDQLETQYRNIKFINSFKAYLKQIINKSFITNIREIKFIFIANRSYQSINKEIIISVKNLIQFQSITEIPFLPYTPQDIFHILKTKANSIHETIGKIIFSDTFLTLTSKRQYSKSQDIRKVINYIYQNYEESQLKKIQKKPSLMTQSQKGIQIQTILNMGNKQKHLFKAMLQLYTKLKQGQKALLVEAIYHQGSKSAIPKHIVDCWLQQWVQLGLIKFKTFQKQGHHLYKTNQISTQVNLNDIKPYFY